MLNISPNSVDRYVDKSRYASLKKIENLRSGKVFKRLLIAFSLVAVVMLFIPWTQNIRSTGEVTTLNPDERPQTIHSIIPGRVEEWFVREGDYVDKGDTILFISEIKDDYFDPQLLSRTEEQIGAKELTVESYMQKVQALDGQIDALSQTSRLKLEQAKNKMQQAKLKVTSDSMSFEAAKINAEVAKKQFDRMTTLYDQGLKSLTDLEERKLTQQKVGAELIEKQNKMLTSRNELINAEVQLVTVTAEYRDKIAKAESEKYTALSSMYDAEATVTKLQNQFMNYSIRQGLYFITSPINGYITRALQTGVGESMKEGTEVVSIMPATYELSVEMYIRPVDLPLLEKGQSVQIQFDGWPAIVFSGWPNTSYGTYAGRVFAIDNFISENGMYRVLVRQDPDAYPWPEALRVGGGTKAMLLLKDVPIWYELWRQINGFPPDYYKTGLDNSESSKSKE